MLHYLQHENNVLKEKHNQLHKLLGEVLEAVKIDAKQRLDQRSQKEKCKYQNRGFCKEGKMCNFVHYNEVCKEHKSFGACPQERVCPFRHPNKCKYWSNGFCWRGPDCVYLHNPDDKNTDELDDHESEQHESEQHQSDDANDEKECESDQHDYDMSETDEKIYEHDNNQITTDEILKMYENVTDIDDDDQITTEEILKIYDSESESGVKEIDSVRKTTRKRKKTIIHGN